MKNHVTRMIIMDNKIHRIIEILDITNVNIDFMIEEENKFLTELIIMGEI